MTGDFLQASVCRTNAASALSPRVRILQWPRLSVEIPVEVEARTFTPNAALGRDKIASILDPVHSHER